jgi:hypothetical protein
LETFIFEWKDEHCFARRARLGDPNLELELTHGWELPCLAHEGGGNHRVIRPLLLIELR